MTRLSTVLAFIVMTFLCWGAYGPVLHEGQVAMENSRWRPFFCVGIAYFLVAVCVPLLLRRFSEESGRWRLKGIVWSLFAGAVGALGSLGVILAFGVGGRPVFVMPLVFGCAPVVNTVVTMLMGGTARKASIPFLLGIILVALGAAGVLRFKPATPHAKPATQVETEAPADTNNEEAQPAKASAFGASLAVIGYVAFTALCWGTYGPLLHRGQAGMEGSRLRPFICVGIAYFFVAILFPTYILWNWGEQGAFSVSGSLWSLVAGGLGAVGALGVIMAFNSGGRPVFVMPLVFGGAPVVNTAISMLRSRLTDGAIGELTTPFLISMGLVIAGATMVLIFAPRGGHPPPGQDVAEPSTENDEASETVEAAGDLA